MGASIHLAPQLWVTVCWSNDLFPTVFESGGGQNMCSFPELKWDSSSKLHNPENDPSDYYLSSFKDDT